MSSVEAYPVAKGRCPHCGGVLKKWTAPKMVEAIRTWAEVYGAPPRVWQWETACDGFPSARSAQQMFGSWSNAVRAAGLQPLKRGGRPYWTREKIIAAIRAWTHADGRPPTSREWKRSGPGHPSSQPVLARFGSWNAGLVAAGAEPRRRGHPRRPPVRIENPEAKVNAEPVKAAVSGYLGENGTFEDFARLVGVSPTWLRGLLATADQVDFGVADRILTAIDRPDVLVGLETS